MSELTPYTVHYSSHPDEKYGPQRTGIVIVPPLGLAAEGLAKLLVMQRGNNQQDRIALRAEVVENSAETTTLIVQHSRTGEMYSTNPEGIARAVANAIDPTGLHQTCIVEHPTPIYQSEHIEQPPSQMPPQNFPGVERR